MERLAEPEAEDSLSKLTKKNCISPFSIDDGKTEFLLELKLIDVEARGLQGGKRLRETLIGRWAMIHWRRFHDDRNGVYHCWDRPFGNLGMVTFLRIITQI